MNDNIKLETLASLPKSSLTLAEARKKLADVINELSDANVEIALIGAVFRSDSEGFEAGVICSALGTQRTISGVLSQCFTEFASEAEQKPILDLAIVQYLHRSNQLKKEAGNG